MLLSDIVHDSARKRPDHEALIVGDRRLTYAELSHRVTHLATAISGLVSAGDRVAILADNGVEYLDCIYGVPQASAILTMVNQRLTGSEVDFVLGNARPRVLIIDHHHLERLGDLAARCPSLERVVVLGASGSVPEGTIAYEELVGEVTPGAAPLPRPDAAATAWLIYTSGTTGRPKGAMLSHHNIISGMLNAMLEWRETPDERVVYCFPLCHVAAFIPLAYHTRQATVVLMKGFDPGRVLALIEEHQITHAGLAPTMLSMILDHPDIGKLDTSSLTLIPYGGSAISPTLLKRGVDRFGDVFMGTYGQTEASGNVLALGVREHRRAADGETHLLASAGRPECLAAVELVDEAMEPVADGEVGEIVIRGDQVMQGYWDNPEATRETIVNGWLRTGDLGRRDDEGFIYIVDRKKDMIVSGGENVFPREVEDVIAAYPGVGEVAVIGVPHDRWGEAVMAVIVPTANATIDPDALTAHCRETLAGYKVPKQVEFRDSLPKNAAMKILKRVLRDEHVAVVSQS